MSDSNSAAFKEVLPKDGELYHADFPTVVLCKPKIMPLKSITLERMNEMQQKMIDETKAQQSQDQASQN